MKSYSIPTGWMLMGDVTIMLAPLPGQLSILNGLTMKCLLRGILNDFKLTFKSRKPPTVQGPSQDFERGGAEQDKSSARKMLRATTPTYVM